MFPGPAIRPTPRPLATPPHAPRTYNNVPSAATATSTPPLRPSGPPGDTTGTGVPTTAPGGRGRTRRPGAFPLRHRPGTHSGSPPARRAQGAARHVVRIAAPPIQRRLRSGPGDSGPRPPPGQCTRQRRDCEQHRVAARQELRPEVMASPRARSGRVSTVRLAAARRDSLEAPSSGRRRRR